MSEFGGMIKRLRKQRNLTLKELAERSNLSVGFLSQLERGLTTIAVDSLQNIARALDVDMSTFFKLSNINQNLLIVHSYERTVSYSESDRYIHQYLSTQIEHRKMFSEIIIIMPEEQSHENIGTVFSHQGEEFIYVIEGILTLNYNHKIYKLHPGDTIHMDSPTPHNWYNSTNQIAKILVVRYPNPFSESESAHDTPQESGDTEEEK
jgi:transcriptional regulator with XRE-family HTH domain